MEPSIRDLLMVRQYAYSALHIIFGQAPTESILTALFSEESLETLEGLAEDTRLPYDSVVGGFEEAKAHYFKPDSNAEALKNLSIEYTRLFTGANTLPAPPWEMVYKTGKRELFQPGVLEIRAVYQSVGCMPAEAPHVSDDHLGIELDFMRFLCEKTRVALEEENEEEATRLETIQLAFLDEHLLDWVPRFLDDLEAATTEPLYTAASRLLRILLELDAKLLRAQ